MTFGEILSVARGERIRAGSINDIITAGAELEKQLAELEQALATAQGKRGARGPRGRAGLLQPVPPPALLPAGVELLTVPQVDRYRTLLTELGCTVPPLGGLSADTYFTLYAADLPTLTGQDARFAPATIDPADATWVLTAVNAGTTYTLTRSSAAGKYTPTEPMPTEPQAVLIGTEGGTTTTTQTLVEGEDVSGTGSVATLTDCPIAQIRWAELGEGSGLYQPIVLPMYLPLF